ncbi:hypothetical protein V8G54_031192 [Vigna mungo]|uniref:Uncharacterized protein n=1 Tax=Vigna mungo TaxID=3915 RepID=A0AAQ3RLY5_VIGMU
MFYLLKNLGWIMLNFLLGFGPPYDIRTLRLMAGFTYYQIFGVPVVLNCFLLLYFNLSKCHVANKILHVPAVHGSASYIKQPWKDLSDNYNALVGSLIVTGYLMQF